MTRGALLLLTLSLVLPASIQSPPFSNTIKIGAFLSLTGKITLDANRNAHVPVYMLRIEKGGKFTLQEQSF
jgi:hypothetical protein